MKIAVIGVGGTGSAALRFLAVAGHDAVGFEQFEIGHTNGSSHGESRIIRLTYPDAYYTKLMPRAYELWRDLQQEAHEELLVKCGGVYFGPANHPKVVATENALIEGGFTYEKNSAHEAMQRVPGLYLSEDEVAIFQSESGFLRATPCVKANVRLALKHGAELHENTAVQNVREENNRVLVTTADATYEFDAAIVTAGAWLGQLFSSLNLPLRVTRQQIVYLQARDEEMYQPQNLPVWIDAGETYYGFPSDGRIEGVKFAAHHVVETVDPNCVNREADEEYLQRCIRYAEKRLPGLTGEVTASAVCLYTNTPREDFILDRAPQTNNIWLVSGCSGHGFKFTVLLGNIAAKLASNNDCDADISRFAWKHSI